MCQLNLESAKVFIKVEELMTLLLAERRKDKCSGKAQECTRYIFRQLGKVADIKTRFDISFKNYNIVLIKCMQLAQIICCL